MSLIQAFVIKTNDIDKSTSSFGNLMPEFIDEQRNKDLLDVRYDAISIIEKLPLMLTSSRCLGSVGLKYLI